MEQKIYSINLNNDHLEYIKNNFCISEDDQSLTIKDNESHTHFLEYLKKENIEIKNIQRHGILINPKQNIALGQSNSLSYTQEANEK